MEQNYIQFVKYSYLKFMILISKFLYFFTVIFIYKKKIIFAEFPRNNSNKYVFLNVDKNNK